MSDSVSVPAAAEVEEEEEKKSRFSFPHPVTFLGVIIVLVWIGTLFIPAGEYQIKDGSPVPGSFHHVPSPLDFRGKLANLALSPINGLYGISGAKGHVGPFESGSLFGGAQVFLFILAIGAFMTVVFATGALDLGIGHLAHRFRARGALLIVVMSVLFGVLGSVMTWSDESLGFYALMIPLMFALGYDRMVTVAVVTVAPFVGAIGSTVTPFRIGVGADAAGVTIGDGIGLRLVLFVLTMTATILYTLRYARRVKADPSRSWVKVEPAEEEHVPTAEQEVEPMTGRHKLIILLVVATFVLLVFSIIPWSDLFGGQTVMADYDTHTTAVKPYSWELGWWLPELSAMFIVMAIVIGVVGRLGEKGTATAIIKGIVDFTGPAIVVPLALAVSVILTNTKTLDTVLNSMEGWVSGTSSQGFTLILAVVTLPLGFLVGSGSAGQALTMPILAPLADFAHVDRSLVVTTYNAVGAWLNLVLPINAILVAGLALAKVPFDRYVRFMLPLMGILLGIIVGVLLIGSAL
ncbi:MAG TPA: hypothetical protein VHC67_09740 [Gaiellaceae bacterium]|jgi:uncharacterized ion transporter superfamily protein YfcC|nr:hypothetical protein [Gaiellaceae bacterium]